MSINIKWRKFIKSPARNLGLQVGETIFWVSRRQMADLSPVFEAMLYGDFQEAAMEIVELSDKDPGEILEMLRCLFPTAGQGYKTKPIDDGNFDLLLRLADEYQIEDLTEKCSTFWGRKMVGKGTEETFELIDQANQYGLKGAVRVGLRKLSIIDPSKLFKMSAFTDLPSNLRQAISIVGWFRQSRPSPNHEYLDYEDDEEWPDDWKDDPIHPNGLRCKHCRYEKCGADGYCECKDDWDPEIHGEEDEPPCLPICHTCNQKYGSTEFVCDCVDPMIKTELEKLGL